MNERGEITTNTTEIQNKQTNKQTKKLQQTTMKNYMPTNWKI